MKKLLITLTLVFVGIQFIPMNVSADLPVKDGDALEMLLVKYKQYLNVHVLTVTLAIPI